MDFQFPKIFLLACENMRSKAPLATSKILFAMLQRPWKEKKNKRTLNSHSWRFQL
jgi:hypothetical protein